MLRANVSLSGVWLQDWGGVYAQTILGMEQIRLKWNWRLDTALYPRWDELVANLSDSGVRVLTYVNSFLSNNASDPQSRYQDAVAQRALLNGSNGAPVPVNGGPDMFPAGVLDLSAERGAAFGEELVRAVRAAGASGWMADFGEYVPLDSRPASGRSAMVEHNSYPQQWQEVNARVAAERRTTRGDEDTPLWFARSSGLTSPSVTPLFWLGDQLHSWDRRDGLASVVVALLSSGVSGHALSHSDVGGYTTVHLWWLDIHYIRSLELLQRWSELALFTAFFRSHEGSVPDQNVQPYDDDALPHLARCSHLFAALAPYRTMLMKEASEHGWPLVRPTWLHFPSDAATLDLDAQFMEGGHLLVAPVLTPHAETVSAYLPAGSWLHAFGNRTIHSTGQTVTLPAAIGEPAALVLLDEAGEPPSELQPFVAAVARLLR